MKPVILDVDTGIDDAMAIAYALHSPELKIIGITTCFGNGTVENTTRNTLQVLDIFTHPHIPVYPGASAPLVREAREKPTWIHGENGLADLELASPSQQPSDIPAHDFISIPIHVATSGDTLGQTKQTDTTGDILCRISVCIRVKADLFVEHFLQRVV